MKKNEILKSGLTLTLCGTLFIGSTLAFFVKSVESQGNIIKTSLLDVEFNYKDGDAWKPVDGSIFNDLNKLSANTSITKEIQIKNTGSLPFEYDINLFREELKESLLEKKIDVTIEKKNSDEKYTNTLEIALTKDQVEFESEYLFNNKDAHEYVITFSMNPNQSLEADVYSGKTLDGFDIQVIANQVSAPGAGRDDVKIEQPQNGIKVITISSESTDSINAVNAVVEDILKEHPNALIEKMEEKAEYYEYTIRVNKQGSTLAMDTAKYDYIVVKVPKTVNIEDTKLNQVNEVPALTKAWAYRNNASDTSVHVTIQTAVDLDLSTGSNDNIEIYYYKNNSTSQSLTNLIASRKKTDDGYLNRTIDGTRYKYPQGRFNKSEYHNDATAGEYTSTLSKNWITASQDVKYIQVIVTKNGKKYDSGLQEVQIRDRQ